MSRRDLERRVERLEKAVNTKAERRTILRSFALWTDRLPEGTVIPEGSRVVQDLHYMHRHLINETDGYYYDGNWAERITADPDDHGYYVPDHPDTGEKTPIPARRKTDEEL